MRCRCPRGLNAASLVSSSSLCPLPLSAQPIPAANATRYHLAATPLFPLFSSLDLKLLPQLLARRCDASPYTHTQAGQLGRRAYISGGQCSKGKCSRLGREQQSQRKTVLKCQGGGALQARRVTRPPCAPPACRPRTCRTTFGSASACRRGSCRLRGGGVGVKVGCWGWWVVATHAAGAQLGAGRGHLRRAARRAAAGGRRAAAAQQAGSSRQGAGSKRGAHTPPAPPTPRTSRLSRCSPWPSPAAGRGPRGSTWGAQRREGGEGSSTHRRRGGAKV